MSDHLPNQIQSVVGAGQMHSECQNKTDAGAPGYL